MLRFPCIVLLICGLWITRVHAAPLVALDTPPQPTGDALWDAYAQAVWQQLLHPDARDLPRAGLVSDSVTGQWGDLGADPRLWQLKLWSSTTAAAWVDELAGEGAGQRTWELLRSAATWATVIDGRHEATVTTRLYGLDLQEKFEVGQPNHWTPPALDDARSFWFQYYDKVRGEGEEFEQEKQQFPNQAWPYYLKALYYEQLGEFGLAQAEIAAGNAKPEFDLPALFPCDKACAMLADDISGKAQLDKGNLIVALAVRDAMGVERLPAVLGELTDFSLSPNEYRYPAEYSADYPLYQLVRKAVDSGDIKQVQALATFAQRAIEARPYDARLAVIGLSAADGLVEQSQSRWEFEGKPAPATQLDTDSWLDLTNLTALSGNPGRAMLFRSYGVGDLAWLYDQRFVQGKTPDEEAWVERTRFWYDHEMPSPQEIAEAWHPDASAPAAAQASLTDTVALLNALARSLRQASADYGLGIMGEAIRDQDWKTLLPPSEQ